MGRKQEVSISPTICHLGDVSSPEHTVQNVDRQRRVNDLSSALEIRTSFCRVGML